MNFFPISNSTTTARATGEPVGRPPLTLLGTEPLRAAIEFVQSRWQQPDTALRGDGHPVLIFPGLGADGTSLTVLRRHCEALGHPSFDWGRGFNTGPRGDVDAWLRRLAREVGRRLDDHELPATLIGWSLGGIYAREIAKLVPSRVRQVITIGTPFRATEDHTHAGWLFRLLSGHKVPLDAAMSRRLRTPPPVPTASIYSRTDGVVAWQTCRHDPRERRKPGVADIEVRSSHIGMGWNPQVLAAVTQLLRRVQSPAAG